MAIFSNIPEGSSLIITPVNDRLTALKNDAKGIMAENIGYGVRTGLVTSAQATPNMTVTIADGVAYLPNGARVEIASTIKTISNPSTVQHTAEAHTTDASGAFTTTYYPITDLNGNYATTTTVVVKKASDDSVVTVSTIDPATGAVDTALTEATDIKIDYYHGQMRIDAVTIDSSGNLTTISGVASDTAPTNPTIPASSLALSNIAINPKIAIKIETANITNLSIKKGIWIDSNYNTIIEGDLTVMGSGVQGEGDFEDLKVRNVIYNPDTGEDVTVNDNLYVTGNITLTGTGTVDGRNVSADGAVLDAHVAKTVDPTSTDSTRDKHLSNNDLNVVNTHVNTTGNVHSMTHANLASVLANDPADTNATKDKHLSNAQAKSWTDHVAATAPHSGHVKTSDVVTSATASKILKLDTNAKLPASITGDAATVGGYSAGVAAGNVLVLDSSALVPLANIPATLTGKSADQLDGYHASSFALATDFTTHTGTTTSAHGGIVAASQVITEAAPAAAGNAGKIVKLDSSGKLEVDITGDAATLGGVAASGYTPIAHVGSGSDAHAMATTLVSGFLSATDKTKLDGIATGAQVNPPCFAAFTDGTTLARANSVSASFRLRSNNDSILTVGVVSDDATYGDYAYWFLHPEAIDHDLLKGLTDDDHTQYVHTTTARTIAAQHTFSPSTAGVPFILGTNAQGQLVTGLNADQVDGYHAGTSANQVLLLDGSGLVPVANLPTTMAGKSADKLDGFESDDFLCMIWMGSGD